VLVPGRLHLLWVWLLDMLRGVSILHVLLLLWWWLLLVRLH
jgi:hypothetical protein